MDIAQRGFEAFVKDGKEVIFVEPCNVKGMREAIKYLLNNPDERKRLALNGRKLIEEKYNSELMMFETAKVAREISNKRINT